MRTLGLLGNRARRHSDGGAHLATGRVFQNVFQKWNKMRGRAQNIKKAVKLPPTFNNAIIINNLEKWIAGYYFLHYNFVELKEPFEII